MGFRLSELITFITETQPALCVVETELLYGLITYVSCTGQLRVRNWRLKEPLLLSAITALVSKYRGILHSVNRASCYIYVRKTNKMPLYLINYSN
jgi:hypothetical protein